MTLDEMIRRLTELRDAGNPGTDVMEAWDPEEERYMPVTAFIFGDNDRIEILTADPEDL
jgi:hypothetical protein